MNSTASAATVNTTHYLRNLNFQGDAVAPRITPPRLPARRAPIP